MTEIAIVNNQQTMSSREIAELTGKEHRHVLADIRKMFEELGETSAGFSADLPDAYGRLQPAFSLPKRETLILVSGYSIELRARIVDRWQELEAQAAKPVAVLPQTYIEALEQLLQAKKAEQLAIETKAQIGARREATAMNTASQAVKKANQLQIELDKSKQYASVKRMEMLYHGQKFDWRKLKSTGQEMGIAPADVFDANYGTVKAYHADVWMETYALPIDVLETV